MIIVAGACFNLKKIKSKSGEKLLLVLEMSERLNECNRRRVCRRGINTVTRAESLEKKKMIAKRTMFCMTKTVKEF